MDQQAVAERHAAEAQVLGQLGSFVRARRSPSIGNNGSDVERGYPRAIAGFPVRRQANTGTDGRPGWTLRGRRRRVRRRGDRPGGAAGGADAPAHARRARRAGAPAGAEGSTLRGAIESGEPHSMILYGPPGTGKTTIARIVARTPSGAFEELSAVNAGRAEVRAVIERARERRARRAADRLLPRRDPPLQQGPAGRAAARGRGRPPDPDRRDDGEPLLRGQLGAALALPDLRARSARRRCAAGAARARARRSGARTRRPARGRRRRARAARRPGRRRRAGCAGRSERAAETARREGGPVTSPAPRTRSSARPSSTTRAATATTTTSRPGSRRPAAPTPTPPSTTWRRCSRAARTRASSPGGW